MKHVFVKVAAIGAVLVVLIAALAVGIIHSVSTHAATTSFQTALSTKAQVLTAQTASAAYSVPCPPTQSEGASNAWVQVIQFSLNAREREYDFSFPHYPLATDGIFGPNTRAAVIAMQRFVKLPGNGIVNPQTWASLNFCTYSTKYVLLGRTSGPECPGLVAYGSSGIWVNALQRMINTYTYYGNLAKTYHGDHWFPLALDGEFGTHTEDAVKTMQAFYHIQQDGIVGNQTWGALGLCY